MRTPAPRREAPPGPLRSGGCGRVAYVLVLLWACLATQGCDTSLAPPTWTTTWVLPADSLVYPVESFLPEGVTVTDDGEAFAYTADGVETSHSLGELCGSACESIDGFTVPKPAFETTVTDRLELPGEVRRLVLSGGEVRLRMENGLSFDPLRPGSVTRGSIYMAATSNGRILGELSIRGAETALTSGGALVRSLILREGPVEGGIDLELNLESPTGDRIRIDTDERVSVVVEPAEVRVREVWVASVEEEISFDDLEFDLGSLGEHAEGRVGNGALVLAVENDFELGADLEAEIHAGSRTISRTMELEPGVSTLVVPFEADEMEAIVEAVAVHVELRGTVTSSGEEVLVRPGSGLVIVPRLELDVEVR